MDRKEFLEALSESANSGRWVWGRDEDGALRAIGRSGQMSVVCCPITAIAQERGEFFPVKDVDFATEFLDLDCRFASSVVHTSDNAPFFSDYDRDLRMEMLSSVGLEPGTEGIDERAE